MAFFTFFTTLFGGGLVSNYILYTRYLHINDTIWVFILPGLVSAFDVIILRTFINSTIPDSLFESAKLDGANDWQIFFKIMFPQAIAMVGSLYVLAWLAEWNSYGTALIYLPKMPTLAVGIYQFEMQMKYASRYDILYAACAISMIPPLLLFALCNNALMSNISLGGIKE